MGMRDSTTSTYIHPLPLAYRRQHELVRRIESILTSRGAAIIDIMGCDPGGHQDQGETRA